MKWTTLKLVGVFGLWFAGCTPETCPPGEAMDSDDVCREHPIDDALDVDPYTGGSYGTAEADSDTATDPN